MATLRNDLFRRPELTAEEEAAYQASGMTELGRTYEGGRITNEVNPMLADIARLRASQDRADLARADELQRRVDALRLRQQAYAPTVGRIEDIDGLGSLADWAAGQVGSGIASMQDPLAVSAGLQGAANLASRGPGILKPISAALRGAGYAVPYLMGREQLIGENYGQMLEDPTLMQNTTAQQRYDAANRAGSVGAVLDTVVPGYIGGRLAGNGLRQGIARSGVGTRAGLTMGMEGATETGQGELGRMALSDLNPNRDTSGDMSARLNEFAGGAIGSGPLAVAGAMADSGYRRTGAAAEAIGTKAGETIDLLSREAGPYADRAMQKAKDLAGKVGGKIDLSAFKGEDGKVDLGKLVNAAREGAVDLAGQARTAATGINRDPRVMELLDFDPADDTKIPQDVALGGPERINQWRNERMALRDEHIFNTLEDLADKGDQRAEQLLTAIEEASERGDGDGVAMGYLEGRDYLRQSMEEEDRRAIQGRAMSLAKLAGKVGAAGAKGVMGLGKAVWDGARGEWTTKRNAQGETDSGFSAILRAELGEGDQGEMAAFVDRLADRIELGLAKWKSAPTKDGDLQLPYNITALAADMRGTYGDRAVQVVEQLAAQRPDMAPGLEALRAEVEAQGTQAGRERAYRARIVAANRVMSLVPAAQRKSFASSGRMHLLDLVERLAEGSAKEGLREALIEAVGASALAKMLEIANGVTKAKDTQREASMFGDRPSDDGPGLGSGEDSDSAADRTKNKEEVGDYQKRAAEKRSTQGRAPSLYGFSRVPTLRNSIRDKDIFGPVEKKEKKKAAGEEDKPVRRPELFKRGQKLKSGANAIEARMAAMERYLGVDKDEIDPSDPYLVSPVSALDIMRRLGMQPAKMMALFRDYMKQEAGEEGMDPALAQKYQELAAQAADAVLDQMDAQKGGEKVRRLTEQQLDKLTKNMQRYFSERFVVVAEQLADRVPEKLTAGEIDDLVKRAQTSLREIEGKAAKGSDAYKRMVAESNTLFFKMKNPKGGAVAVEVPIRVKDLVRWVREQRNMNEQWEGDPSGWKKDDIFLADVLSGINAVLASGRMTEALPYMRNNFGDVESFADGIPGSLRLATKPMWQITRDKEKKLEGIQTRTPIAGPRDPRSVENATQNPEHQAKVAKEYGPDVERGSDIDSPEPNIKAGESGLGTAIYDSEFYQMGYNSSWDDYLTDDDRRVLRAPPSSHRNAKLRKIAMRIRTELGPDAAREFRKDVQVAGGTAIETNPRARASAKTDDPNATPLDFYPKRKEGEAYDERDDVLYRTKQGGKSAYSPLEYEPPMTATGKLLEDRADRIRRALLGDFVLARELNALGAKATTLKPAQVAEIDRAQRNGLSMLVDRIRTAARPVRAKKGEAVGGFHYIYPALVALKPENIEDYAHAGGSSPFLEDTLQNLREVALRMIIDAPLSDEKKLAAIKMMAPDEAVERLNLANFKKYAERNAMPFHIPMAPTNEKVLNTLERIAPTYRDTTRDVSKKSVEPTTREVGARGEARSLPADNYRRSKLTAAQEAEYAKLKTQDERDEYLSNVANPRPNIKVRKSSPQPAVQQVENAEARAMKYLEYLNNPPDTYEPKHAVGIRRWAERVLAESTDEAVRSAARTLLKKAESVIEGDGSLSRIENAGSEVPAQGPKSQSKPAGARKLNGRSPYLAKDQRKADQATKFIGRGSPASSTAQYARDLKGIANTGQYTADDVVFISAEGARADRVDPDFAEIRKAIKAGVTFITDDAPSRSRPYNVGERQVAKFLTEEGYRESAPGRWTPGTVAVESRLPGLAQKALGLGAETDRANKALALIREEAHLAYQMGVPKSALMEIPSVAKAMADLVGIKLVDPEGGAMVVDTATNTVDQIYAQPLDLGLAKQLKQMIAKPTTPEGVPLAELLRAIRASSLPESAKVIARAVSKVAGATPVRVGETNAGYAGRYLLLEDAIELDVTRPTLPSTTLHEGVHAATVKAIVRDPELHRAVYQLMSHVAKQDPKLVQAYGMTTTLEFIAEGMSNLGFQRRLYKISASPVVERYLGQTLANAWEAFTELMRKALNLPPSSKNALTQLIELTGRAMKGAAQGAVFERAEIDAFTKRAVVPVDEVAPFVATIEKSPHLAENDREAIRAMLGELLDDAIDYGGLPHNAAAVLATVARIVESMPPAAPFTAEQFLEMLEGLKQIVNSVPSQIGARLNAQANGPYSGWKAGTPSTDKEVAQAKAYIDRVLGPKIKVDFEETMGHSGEWIEASETIKIALNAAAGILPTAYHEALHAFFSKYVKSNPKVLNVMKALAENEQVLARVYALLDGYPAAQAQLRDGEERLAYIYQFWAAGQLDLPTPQARTWLQKLRKFFWQVLGRVTAEERAGAILEALHEGKLREPDAAQRVLAELVADKAWTTKARRNFDGLMQGVAALAMPAHSILLESASPTARRLADLFFANPGDESAGGKVGYLNAVRNERTRRTNAIGRAIEGLSEKDQAAVVRYLQQAKDPAQIPYEPHANAVRTIRAELDDFWTYATNAGVDLGKIQDYFPVVWDTEVLIAKREEFIQMLMEHYRPQLEDARASAVEKGVHITLEEAASRLHSVIVDRQVFDGKLAVGREDGVLIPFFEASNNRTLDWIAPEHREPFLDKSLVGTLSRYFHQGVRAAEYTRRFGADGKQLESRLDDIKDELNEAAKTVPGLDTADAREKWVQRQYRDVRNAVAAMEGTLGKDITDTHRKINSWMIVYQNIRLLPLSLFSSFVDPLSMVARGADFKTAGEAFLNGLREVFRGWRDMIAGMPENRQKDEWEKMAEFVGTTESAIFAHYVAETYSSQYMSPRAKRINDMMFKLNGMEAWNRAMRVGATKGAVQFIIKHKDLPEQHSQRWLKELGLTSEDIVVRDGKLIVDKAELMAMGMDDQKAEDISMKNKAAINRWVEGAVLTPNSAQRPAWASDPRWSFLFHLKQFTYSFHQTILKRVWGEIKHGNLAPAGVMAMFIPTMIASDIAKGLIQGGGDLPAYMKGMDAGDWVLRGAERSGVLGYGQIGVDTRADWSSLAGPSVEQVIDALRQPIDQTIVKALPANPLYREAFR